MGRTWLSSQSHGRELECGEPVCLPLLSLSESSVCHSPSPSVTPQSAADTQSPLMHLSILAVVAYDSRTYSPLQKESMSSSSPETGLKRPGSPCGISTLPQPIDQLNPPHVIHLSVCRLVSAPCHLTPGSTTCVYAHRGYLSDFC